MATPPAIEPNYTEYQSPYGWSLKYDPALFVVNPVGGTNNEVDFLYSGQAAGTTMVSFYIINGKYPEDVIYEKTLGLSDNYEVSNADLFFGPAVIADAKVPEGQDSGAREHMTAVAFTGGTLFIDANYHMSGDDAIDVPMNDAMAVLYDSLMLTGTGSSSSSSFDGFASEDTADDVVFMGGLYANDGKSDMNLALFREADGNPTVLVQIGADYYYGNLNTTEKKLEDGSAYTALTLGGKEFGYRFDDESLTVGIVVDAAGEMHSAVTLDESVAKDMLLEYRLDSVAVDGETPTEDAAGEEDTGAEADAAR